VRELNNGNPPEGKTVVRWKMLALLFVVSFVAYLLRMNINVAAKFMMPDLGLSQMQMGWVFTAFVWGYALFQLPGGVFGELVGPRHALAIITLGWVVVTVLTGLLPGTAFISAGGILLSLIALRFLMGVIQAPLFPVTAGSVAYWFPVAGWAFPNGLLSMGLSLGAAFTPPLVAWLMLTLGWRESFYVMTPLALVIILLWWRYATDTPAEHPGVGQRELALINSGRPPEVKVSEKVVLKRLITNRGTLLLTASYLCMNYVFYIFFSWFYIYLTDVRKFGILEGGFYASLPFMVGALAASLGGWICDHLCRRMGPRWGCRLPAAIGLLLVGAFLLVGIMVKSAPLAIVFLSLCFGCTQLTEGPYWAAATYIGGRHTPAATGVMNTGGNLGGVISTPLIPILVDHVGWVPALATGSLFAVMAALIWFWVRADEPLLEPTTARATEGA
jgi:ACS family glucarate transporter-like MFS transporter